MTDDFPRNAFRVTAFADVLGWGQLTAGMDQLIARKLARGEPLSLTERVTVDDLHSRIGIAQNLDRRVREILQELREFATPDTEVAGEPGPRHFWSNRHVTFIRFSDNVFLHSTSFRWVVQFLSELLKRGLERGVLFRSGLSAGHVFHAEPTLTDVDSRSRDVSLYGDAITTAVAAERAGKGRGARVFIHPHLEPLLRDDLEAVLQRIDGCSDGVTHELRWWTDFRSVWPASSVCDSIPIRENWPQMACKQLRSNPAFQWNRASPKGAPVVEDTILALSTDPVPADAALMTAG